MTNSTNVFKERRSIRSYDPSVKISKEEMMDILEEATYAPSSNNLQTWRFLVIDDQELKKKLHPIAYNQQQILDASAVIVVLADLEGHLRAEEIYDIAVKQGTMSEEVRNRQVDGIKNTTWNSDATRIKNIALVDAGLVSMQLMLVAKTRGYDTVPMGGYVPDLLVKEFDIPERYAPVMLLAIGKGVGKAHPYFRLPVEEVTFWDGMK
ncbi:nitroreductase family protein [Neobacillus mesonae]|nr:nitroreductase family protein [Neobacillus mesonae]